MKGDKQCSCKMTLWPLYFACSWSLCTIFVRAGQLAKAWHPEEWLEHVCVERAVQHWPQA